MKFARSRLELFVGLILLVLLVAAWCVVVDERASANLSENDLTWEESRHE